MKNYKILLPIVLVLLMVFSWYQLIIQRQEVAGAYEEHLAQARVHAETGVTKYAMEEYNKALAIKDKPDIYVEVAEYHKKHSKNKDYLSWCEYFLEKYPTEVKAYECILDGYLVDKNYASSYDTLDMAEKRNVDSKYIQKVREDIKYTFKMDTNYYEDVGQFSNFFCPVYNGKAWGYVNRYGKRRIGSRYNEAGPFNQDGFAPIVDKEEEAYFVDIEGDKVMATNDSYNKFAILIDEMMVAQKPNGKYTYLDQEFNVLFGDYDYASSMKEGVAAVLSGDKWTLINKDGDKLSNTTYLDVKLDENDNAYCNERLFVKIDNGKYIMIDSKGKQIGKLEFEDSKLFTDESFAAVKIDEKWCFVNKDGQLISEKKYDDARSFSNELAAVKIDDEWGFVDENEEIKIEAQFSDAKDFTARGSCFVKEKDRDQWQLLKLYRLNR